MDYDNAGHTRRMPSKLKSLLATTVADGEQVVWFEQPDVRRWRRKGYVAVPFGLAVLALVFYASPWTRGGWYWLVAAFVLPGLVLVALPLLMISFAKSTLYVITSQRALILSTDTNGLRSYPLQELPEIVMRLRSDGSGDLVLETEDFVDAEGDPRQREHAFEDIREVGLVRQILEDLKRGKETGLVRRYAALWRRV